MNKVVAGADEAVKTATDSMRLTYTQILNVLEDDRKGQRLVFPG